MIKKNFTPSGFTAVADRTSCTGCRLCTKVTCPQDAITFDAVDYRIRINQEYCVGCGICKNLCPHEVIKIKQTMPMRTSIHEHFYREARLDIKNTKMPVYPPDREDRQA